MTALGYTRFLALSLVLSISLSSVSHADENAPSFVQNARKKALSLLAAASAAASVFAPVNGEAARVNYLEAMPGPGVSAYGHAAIEVDGMVYDFNRGAEGNDNTVYKIKSFGEFRAHYAAQGRAVVVHPLQDRPGAAEAIKAAAPSVARWYLASKFGWSSHNCTAASMKLLHSGYPELPDGATMLKPGNMNGKLRSKGVTADVAPKASVQKQLDARAQQARAAAPVAQAVPAQKAKKALR